MTSFQIDGVCAWTGQSHTHRFVNFTSEKLYTDAMHTLESNLAKPTDGGAKVLRSFPLAFSARSIEGRLELRAAIVAESRSTK
jgi:hypothetical protein